ncbi:MAG: hypothetical protein JW993_10770 [Sedimentisphaerales bacterium]|nr:hypothetical protein [Sedimentisphaerales bacterium]
MTKGHAIVLQFVLSLVVFGCFSCGEPKYLIGNKIYSGREFVAQRRQEHDLVLSLIVPTDTPVGGSLVVIIPTDELIARTFGSAKLRGAAEARTGRLNVPYEIVKDQFETMIEAVRKRGIFENVEWRTSTDPEQEPFETDFALIYPARKEAEWLLRNRTQAGYNTTPIAFAPSSLSQFQRTMVWLNNVEQASRRARQP